VRGDGGREDLMQWGWEDGRGMWVWVGEDVSDFDGYDRHAAVEDRGCDTLHSTKGIPDLMPTAQAVLLVPLEAFAFWVEIELAGCSTSLHNIDTEGRLNNWSNESERWAECLGALRRVLSLPAINGYAGASLAVESVVSLCNTEVR
jgi:hypothetical protein